ncbi:hypothetical protein [Parasitella parasitica]|uniref:Uncharacterized protein n=1 Tax=Parasitella parasitica TaxID=35722 RepID=A0A0B7N4I0_9FUNG|nr:hypothetical protein [Parasitella parasitica]
MQADVHKILIQNSSQNQTSLLSHFGAGSSGSGSNAKNNNDSLDNTGSPMNLEESITFETTENSVFFDETMGDTKETQQVNSSLSSNIARADINTYGNDVEYNESEQDLVDVDNDIFDQIEDDITSRDGSSYINEYLESIQDKFRKFICPGCSKNKAVPEFMNNDGYTKSLLARRIIDIKECAEIPAFLTKKSGRLDSSANAIVDWPTATQQYPFKAASNIGSLSHGVNVFDALYTVTNEYEEIRLQFFVPTKSLVHLIGSFDKMYNVYNMYGYTLLKLFYTDNVRSDRHFLEKHLPSLLENVQHIDGLPVAAIPSNVEIFVNNAVQEINDSCDRILRDYHDLSILVHFKRCTRNGRCIARISLATFNFEPEQLKSLSPDLTKTLPLAHVAIFPMNSVSMIPSAYGYIRQKTSQEFGPPIQRNLQTNSTVLFEITEVLKPNMRLPEHGPRKSLANTGCAHPFIVVKKSMLRKCSESHDSGNVVASSGMDARVGRIDNTGDLQHYDQQLSIDQDDESLDTTSDTVVYKSRI